MFTAAIIFITFVWFLLILVVLIQNSKGGGVASGFSGSTNLMGVKRTSDLLENITWGLAITLLVGCLATNFLVDKTGMEDQTISSPNIERAQESGFAAPQQQQQSTEAQPAADEKK